MEYFATYGTHMTEEEVDMNTYPQNRSETLEEKSYRDALLAATRPAGGLLGQLKAARMLAANRGISRDQAEIALMAIPAIESKDFDGFTFPYYRPEDLI